MAIIAAIAMQPWISAQIVEASTLFSAAVVGGGGAAAGMASSVTSSLVNGQGLGAGFRAGLHAAPANALQAFGAWEVGNLFFEGSSTAKPGYLREAFGEYAGGAKAVAHGLVGGASSVAGHGSFLSGFAAGMGGELAAGRGVVASALAGGTAAAVSGGKFSDGAMRGSSVYLFNSCLHGGCEGIGSEIVSERTGEQRYVASGPAISIFDSGPLAAATVTHNPRGELATGVIGALGLRLSGKITSKSIR